MRISIVGLSGSGKSTLAQKISEKFGIPHVHIDRIWFEAGGHRSAGDEKDRERVRAVIKEKVEELVRQDGWVTDGWYGHVQPIIAERADHIVFLDIPLYKRLASHLWRTFFEERHTELTRWDDIKFVYQIVRRTSVHGPKIREYVRKNAGKVKTLHSYKEVDRYFADLR
ncbi:MAG: AAA family ATPase [Candidatus Pacebacteria bacterium]|nr:AAA family ATPase [Candidatus Paceibacterota bacterium]